MQNDTLFTEMWRLGKILERRKIPMWTTDEHGRRIPWEYEPESIAYMEKRHKELQNEWRQKHPNSLLNGGD